MNTEPLSILLVEDDLDHAELVLRQFAQHRVENRVTHLRDGEEALDFLLRRGHYQDPQTSPRPHLVLLDLRLPTLDGAEVLRQIKSTEAVKSIPVVILTSSNAGSDISSAYDNHANSYLVKPLGFGNLTRLIDEMGHYWLARNQHSWDSN